MFFLFAGDRYYPRGGVQDLQGSYETELEARAELFKAARNFDWGHICDEKLQIVESFSNL